MTLANVAKKKRKREAMNFSSESAIFAKACNRWFEREDVFLSGIVMDIYYRRHSLKPTNDEKNQAKEKGVSYDMLVWQEISARYNVARERFKTLTGKMSPARSTKSLQRHWKETGLKRFARFVEQEGVPATKRREQCWDQFFNYKQVLSCDDSDFQKFIADESKVKRYQQLIESSFPKRQKQEIRL